MVPASGQVLKCGPLSVEYWTMVLSAMPRSSISFSNSPTCRSCSTMPSWYSSPLGPLRPVCSFFTWVRKCMRVAFHQQKNGLPALCLAR